MTHKLDATIVTNPDILPGSVAVEDAHDLVIVVDDTTRETDPLEIVAMMDETTEDRQIVGATTEEIVMTAVRTSDAMIVGHAVVITALVEIVVTIAHAEIDETKESIAVGALMLTEAVMRKSVPDLQHFAVGAKIVIQVNNNIKNRRPHSPSDAIINQYFQMLTFAFFRIPAP